MFILRVKINYDATINLPMIRFIVDKTYPDPDYVFSFSSRMFYDFINNSDSKFDRSWNIVSIQESINEPMMFFKVNTDAKTYNESLQVYINMFECDSGITTGYEAGSSQLLIVAIYDETFRMTFDLEKVTAVELIY